jgi:NAD(P)-dependent dehydrogenase (short-subunit alcohol dehydrogenase family)
MQHKRVAMVTGANQGVGLQVAKELVANGFNGAGRRAPSRARRGRGQGVVGDRGDRVSLTRPNLVFDEEVEHSPRFAVWKTRAAGYLEFETA